MRVNSFNIEVTKAGFLIKKTRRVLVSDFIWFAVFIVAMAAIFVFLYLKVKTSEYLLYASEPRRNCLRLKLSWNFILVSN